MNLWLIPILPLIGFLINGILGRRLPKMVINLVACGSVALSFAWVLKTLTSGLNFDQPNIEHYFTWIASGTVNIGVDLMVDKLTAVMLCVVTGVGLLIHIYATGYMAHEDGYYRFFAYLNLFMFFMLTLVMGANFLVLFVGWEGVGLCSYLLIGFYYKEKFAGDAGKKAFIVNRIGDFGFALGMFLIVTTFGSLDFGTVFSAAGKMPKEETAGILTAITLLLILGATGKSAQIPLYVWLPDAMAGPTPVSALIHAATMVTAGVYMVTRSHVMFTNAPVSMEVLAVIGLLTAVVSASIGLCQTDIKKVFAYSTVSQLGFMFLGLGVGAYSAGIFHLMTHAFFKALLFLGAGSVIHGCHHEQELSQMGGLFKKMPITAITLLLAGFAIAGLPFTSGAASKDLILESAYLHHPWMYWVGLGTACLTAFYVFRAWFLAFMGKYRGHAHPHESPLSMTVPLMILAVLSIAGWIGPFNIPHWLESFTHEGHPEVDSMIAMLPFGAGFLGIILAYVFYVASPSIPESLAKTFAGPYRWIYNKYFVDEGYDGAIVHPIEHGSRHLLWKGIDVNVIDGAVNGIGGRARALGGVLRWAQSGSIRNYASWVAFGCVIVLIAMGVMGGEK